MKAICCGSFDPITKGHEDIVRRARFLNGKVTHMAGGLDKERRTGMTKEV